MLTFILTTVGAIVFVSINTTLFSKDMIDWMAGVEYMFLAYDGGSNRHNIQWNDASDFYIIHCGGSHGVHRPHSN